MGGHRGRALHAGDVLTLGAATVSPSGLRVIDMPRCGSGARLRVLPGPQEDWFDDDAWSALTSGRFEVSSRSERMGYRLAGPPIPLGRARRSDRDGATMISDATFPGAIQVTPAGEAVLLMADRQTTGGYPQMATVISADLPRAGQLAPGDWVAFEVCRLTDALAALVAQESQLLALE